MEELMSKRPEFTESQKRAIFLAAGRKVAMSVCRLAYDITADELEGAAGTEVYGVFVSLKRFGQLRACCGYLGEDMPLERALNESAQRSATEDFRFPVIHSSELREMKMEVWVLSGPERIVAKGADIFKFIEIGKHGLQIHRGRQHGLLLPGVATELQLEPLSFLEHTCVKAGLPPDSWQDPQTMVFRFEGFPISGNLKDALTADMPIDPPPEGNKGPDVRHLAALADHCYRNIEKYLRGGIPDIYLPGAYDGLVNGACVRLKMARQYMDCAHTSLNGVEPLQATLLKIAENAAVSLKKHRILSLENIQVSLTVFWDVHSVGTGERCSLEHVHSKEYGIIVQRDGRWTLCYEPKDTPRELLEDALKRSVFPKDEQTAVYVAKVRSTEPSFVTGTVQVPQTEASVRPPAVAGMFYPDSEREMENELKQMLAESPEEASGRDFQENEGFGEELSPEEVFQPWGGKFFVGPKEAYAGAVVPHAGWQYSGRLAAQTLSQIIFPKHILIFAPKHRNIGADWAISPFEKWDLPGRPMQGDPGMARQMAEAVPEFQLDASAHFQEHAIEVQLPILAQLAPGSHVLGVVLHGKTEHLPEAAKRLAKWLRTLPQRPLLIASSDMNHYATDRETRRKDAPVLEAMRRRDPEEMLKCVQEGNVSMCGCLPVALMMMTLRELSLLNEAVPVGYCTSADATGDKRQVVGYCGMLFK